ncbi:MAG: isopeptide-forming domain-containing fimbrial protein [Clostridia bacterium]|nr:isopeptide-forming domain-containing fimbrial protein [Clostridia bacterium]
MAKKVINSDIYNISGLVDDVKKEYLPDETDSTLAISTYGYIGAIESKRLQTQIQMTSELANEAFPSRARLERNIITHAIMYNIEGINASPSILNALFFIRQIDINDSVDADGIFILDRECPIYLEDYEFHLEYDIILKRTTISGNENVYTAQYDISRENPISNVTNPYLTSPVVSYIDDEPYIVLSVILRQVHHQEEYSKLVTSNVIDNKTINFTFEDQLAYFEVKVNESDDEVYLTPVFEGSGVPDDVALYCWYQYIDTHTIRVRFDRNSYMPGLNSEIEILIKTCKGAEPNNLSYTDSLFVNFESSKYGYKNLTVLFKSQSDITNGKDRKSKKELQSLLPKEALARGSLTTIKDLNNYFGMLDSDNGRIVIQKKIDNQIERTYYAYLVLKDELGDIVPTNTIDVRVPMDKFIKTQLTSLQSPRYVSQSGSCFKLGADGVGEIFNGAIKNTQLYYDLGALQPNKDITVKFSVKITDPTYDTYDCQGYVKKEGYPDCSSKCIESPLSDSSEYEPTILTDAELVENNEMVSIGQTIRFNVDYTSISKDTDIVFTETLDKGFTYVPGTTFFIYNGKMTECVVEVSGQDVAFTIPKEFNTEEGSNFTLSFDVKVNKDAELTLSESVKISEGSNSTTSPIITIRTLHLSITNNPTSFEDTTVIEYTAKFKSSKTSSSYMKFELSRGMTYVPGSSYIDTGLEGPMNFDPDQSDITNKAGFLYTNPFSVSINQYHLYSSFYMMCIDESPYLDYNYINQKSSMQFIGTNLNWYRPFIGDDKDKYRMSIDITQSISKDLGLIEKDEDGNVTGAGVKVIALFCRNNDGTTPSPYRYKELTLTNIDEEIFTYSFETYLEAADEIDNSNNIKINNVGVVGQTATDYGYFNPNTTVYIYSLCKLPNYDGTHTRYDLDKYVPGLEGWTVTNMYNVNNGLNFYQTYADIMGSRVEPYGSTKEVNGETVLIPEGYLIKGIPVFGYDYSQDPYLIDRAIDALNYRKAYIDETIMVQENSFGIDFKFFNTYGPSKTLYVIKDTNVNNILDDGAEFIDRVDIAMHFRMKLLNSSDTHTKDLVIKDIKDYIEDLNELGAIHIPNLVTQITNTYKESITYFEFLGFNNYKADIQHIYKLADSQIGIHIPPEHISIRNVKDADGSMVPDITIYISES